MKKCSVCKKNIAVIFAADMNSKDKGMKGICVPCAKKMGIPIVDQLMEQTGMDESEVEGLVEQMNGMFDDIDDIDSTEDDPESKSKRENLFKDFFKSANSPNKVFKDFSKEENNIQNKKEQDSNNKKDNNKSSFFKSNKSKKKFLELYGTNLTEKASEGLVDRIIGRNREIDRVVQILNRRSKNNPVLLGEPGVGKTAIAEGLAVRIHEKQVPAKLINTEIYLLDLTAIVAGTQFRGQFEGRMKAIISEANKLGNIILVIDEIHNIIGAGEVQGGVMNAGNILKPSLARGEIQIVGATTLEEYRKHIEKDAALERRFQKVIVDEPNIEESIEIIEGIKDYYENYHRVKISNEVIQSAVKLSQRYINDRYLPDKAIDVIDEAGSRANLKNKGLVELEALKEDLIKAKEKRDKAAENNDFEKAAEYKADEIMLEEKIKEINSLDLDTEIKVEDIAYVIESWTKIPIQKITKEEAKKLLDLENNLHKRVIGQNKAISSLAKTIRRNRSGFTKRNKPSSFIFVGPTGVGKTESVKALAEELFGSEDSMIRVDMSEYMEKHTVSKLIGAPPGYVGFDQGGQLTEKIRRKPYSVILLDEIEKAHPDVFNMLLQILEDGRLTDSQGRTVYFDNTVIIMTSNIGTSSKSNNMGFGKTDREETESKVNTKLKEFFRPEFLNRIDNIVVFEKLLKDELRKIVDIMLMEVKREAIEKDMTLEISDSVKEMILEKGYDEKYGARPIRRTIQMYIEDEISEKYLKEEIKDGDNIIVDYKEGNIVIEHKLDKAWKISTFK